MEREDNFLTVLLLYSVKRVNQIAFLTEENKY